MAKNYNITMKQDNGTDYDNLYPKTISSQVLLSKQARDDLNLAEGSTATDAVNSIQKDGGAFQIGDTLTTARTDLGNKWLLCNGANEDATVYPDLSKLFPVVAKRENDITVSPAVNNLYVNAKFDDNILFSQGSNYLKSGTDYSTITQLTSGGATSKAYIPSLNKYAWYGGSEQIPHFQMGLIDAPNATGSIEYVGPNMTKGNVAGYRYAGNYLFALTWSYEESTYFVGFDAYDPANNFDFVFSINGFSSHQPVSMNRTIDVVYSNGIYASGLAQYTSAASPQYTYSFKTKSASDTSTYIMNISPTSMGTIAANSTKIFAFYNNKLQWAENGLNWTEVGGVSFSTATNFNVTAITATDNYCFCWVLNNNVGTVYRLTSDFKTAVKCFDTPSGVTVNNIIIEEANNRVLYWMSNGTWLVSDLGSQFTLPTVSLSDNTYTYIKALK